MNSSKLPLVVLLIVLAGIATYMLLPKGDDNQAGTLPVVDAQSELKATPHTEEATSKDNTAHAREAVASRAALPTTGKPELDPELRVEMAGFEGRVLHHDGTPAGEHRVVLYRFDADGIMGEFDNVMGGEIIAPDVDAGEVMTDAEGRFLLEGVWPRSIYLLHAGVGSDNPTPKIIERTPRNREVIDLGDIYLRDGAVVTGTVVDEDAAPVAGAVVRVIDLPPQMMQMVPFDRFDPEGALIVYQGRENLVIAFPAWVKQRFEQLPLPWTVTAEDGSFRVTGIPPGNGNVVMAAKHGLLGATRPGVQLKAGKEKDVGSLRMKLGEEVYGSVKDAAGEPIADAEILLGQGGMLGAVHFAGRAVRSAADGSFSAAGFKPGKVIAAARRQPGQPWLVIEPQSVMRDLDIVMSQGFDLTVRVTSSVGQVIENPELDLFPGEANDGAVEMKRYGFSQPIATEDNLVEIEDGRYRFTDIPAGTYVLMARAPGHAIAGQEIELDANEEATVRLEPEIGLTVRVSHRNGTPIRAAMVYVETRGARRQQVGRMPSPAGRTGSDGRLAVTGVTRGELRLSVRHPRYGWVHGEANVPGPELSLVFDEPGAIQGVLTEKGQVPEPGKWTLAANRQGQSSAMPEMPKLTIPDAEGSFELPGLQPGEYDIEVVESLSKYTTLGSLVAGSMLGQTFTIGQERRFTVVAGQTTHVTLDTEADPAVIDGPSGTVSGTVVVNGLPAEGMAVNGWGEGGQVQATVDASGHFDLGQVGAGHLYLRVRNTDQGSGIMSSGVMWAQSVTVVENEHQTVNVDLQTGGLSGAVIAPDGSPAAGAQVVLAGQTTGDDSGTAQFGMLSDDNGQFEFTDVPSGTYQLTANHGELGSGMARGLELNTGVQHHSIHLVTTVTVSGNIDRRAFGENVTHCWMTFHAEGEGADQNWSQIDEDGTFEVENVIPGTYRAHIWVNYAEGPGTQFEHATPIQVGSAGIEGLTLQLQKVEHKQPDK